MALQVTDPLHPAVTDAKPLRRARRKLFGQKQQQCLGSKCTVQTSPANSSWGAKDCGDPAKDQVKSRM